VDFRVSTIPSLHGETVVLRVLDRTVVAFDYAQLGRPPPVIARLRAALELPNGIVLVTGPTGSGKTTTLYSGLLALNAETRKVVTVGRRSRDRRRGADAATARDTRRHRSTNRAAACRLWGTDRSSCPRLSAAPAASPSSRIAEARAQRAHLAMKFGPGIPSSLTMPSESRLFTCPWVRG
jgi:energy-coupling factor transporter ATP-binding protein EcfA2